MIPTQAQICDELSRQQPEFPGVLSRNAQMTLNVKVSVWYLHFQYQTREFKYAYIWRNFADSMSNPLQVIARKSRIFYNSESKWLK